MIKNKDYLIEITKIKTEIYEQKKVTQRLEYMLLRNIIQRNKEESI